jgi:hypothetical protein
MANPLNLAELHAVFQTCGIADKATRALMIGREGFDNLASLGKLKDHDRDITEMVKAMASCTVADGRVHLGIVIVKNLQTLVWWVRDRQKRNIALHAADFDPDTLDNTAVMKDLYKERASKEPSVTALAKFDPDDFDTHEDAFLNLMSQTFGVLNEPLRYVVRPVTLRTAYGSDEEEQMYQFPLEGPGFQMDNMAVYRKFKAFLIDSPGWAWIEPHDMAENCRAAYLAWIAHYDGCELSKRTALAKAKLKTLHYKSKQSMSFERCTEIMTQSAFIHFTKIRTNDTPKNGKLKSSFKLYKSLTRNSRRRKSSRKAYTATTSPTPADTFHSKFHEFTHPLSWSTDEANPVSAAFMPLTVRQVAADGDEAAMEDTMAAEDDAVEDEDVTPATGDDVIILTV